VCRRCLPANRSQSRNWFSGSIGTGQRFYVRPDGTHTGEHITIRCALRPLIGQNGNLPAKQLSPLKVFGLQETLIAQEWSRRYINKAVSTIRRCYRWAKDRELVSVGVAAQLRGIKGVKPGYMGVKDPPPIEPVSDVDAEKTLPEGVDRL
jgi:hypothetical protein